MTQTEMDKLSFISYGFILPVIIVFGLSGNIIALCILHHRFLQRSPVSLLKLLALHGIFTMGMSIVYEVVPTIQMMLQKPSFANISLENNNSSENINSLNVTSYNNNSLYYNPGRINSTVKTSATIGNCGRPTLSNSIETFLAYNLIHYGLLITFCMTIGRLIAVMFPLKAKNCLTSSKTKILVVLLFVFSTAVHLPQLIKEISIIQFMECTDTQHSVNYIRKHYQTFFAYSSLFVCVVIFMMNVILLIKLLMIKKNLQHCRHGQIPQRSELNVSVAIAVLVFFQLPFYVFSAVLAELPLSYIFANINQLFSIKAISRLLYIAHSALNFVIYCLMAQNCRHVLHLVIKRVSSTSLSHSFKLNDHARSAGKNQEDVPLRSQNMQETHDEYHNSVV